MTFSPNHKYLFVDDQSGPLSHSSRDVAMATILGKIGETTFIRHPSILKRIGISQYFIAPMILLHRVQIYLIIYNDSRRVHAVQIQSRPYRARQ